MLKTNTQITEIKTLFVFSALSSFPEACADIERWPAHVGDPLPFGICELCVG